MRNSRFAECCAPNPFGGFVVLARRSVARKEPVTWSGKRELVSKRIHGDWSERDFRYTILRLRIRNFDPRRQLNVTALAC
jgi:hypothetical protein